MIIYDILDKENILLFLIIKININYE